MSKTFVLITGASRGFGQAEFRQIGEWIIETLDGLSADGDANVAVENAVRQKVSELCNRFPTYRDM